MLSWVIQITFISIILIFLVHHLINFFKSTLTVPKIKDLVNSPNQKYQNIYDTLSHKTTSKLSQLPSFIILTPTDPEFANCGGKNNVTDIGGIAVVTKATKTQLLPYTSQT
jgi:hypothetical protein